MTTGKGERANIRSPFPPTLSTTYRKSDGSQWSEFDSQLEPPERPQTFYSQWRRRNMNENTFFIIGLAIMAAIWIAHQLADANDTINRAINTVHR